MMASTSSSSSKFTSKSPLSLFSSSAVWRRLVGKMRPKIQIERDSNLTFTESARTRASSASSSFAATGILLGILL